MFELRAKSEANEFDMMLHGTIGEWDKVNASDFSRAMNAAYSQGAKKINLKIHSPGGNPFEGIAIGTKIMECRARGMKVHAVIEGMAASMMSAVTTFCDSTSIAKHARMMVHQSRGIAVGSAAQILGYGNMMVTMNETLAELYAGKTGKEKKWVLDNWMAEGKDKWFNHTEAIQAKLADAEAGESKVKALAAEDASYFQMAAHYDQYFNDTTDTMNKTELIALLGLKAEATDAEINAALKTLKAKADGASPATPAPGAPAQPADEKTKLAESIVAMAKERGADEALQATIKTIALLDASAALSLVPKGEAKAEDKKTEPEKPLSISDLLTAMKGGASTGPADRKDWGYDDWSAKDSAGLLAMARTKTADFVALFEKKYGYKPSETEIKQLAA